MDGDLLGREGADAAWAAGADTSGGSADASGEPSSPWHAKQDALRCARAALLRIR